MKGQAVELGGVNQVLCDLLGTPEDGPDPRDVTAGLGLGEWEEVVRKSLAHKVAPILYGRLRPLVRGGEVPEGVGERFRAIYLHNLGRNMRRFHRLGQLLRVLSLNGIRVAVLKGAHLAEAVYGDIGLRPMNDLDILVGKKDLARTMECITEAGFFSPENPLNLDVHTRLSTSIADLKISTEAVMDRARPLSVAGEETWGLCPEDLLLHLVVHLSIIDLYGGTGLRGLCDVRQTILRHHRELDWERVARRAADWGVVNAVRLTLGLAGELLGVLAQEATDAGLGSAGVDPRTVAWARGRIFDEKEREEAISPYFWDLWRRGSSRGRAATLRTLLFPPPEVMTTRYQSSAGIVRTGLTYFIRFKNRLAPYAKVLHGMLARDRRVLSRLENEQRNLEMLEWLSSE